MKNIKKKYLDKMFHVKHCWSIGNTGRKEKYMKHWTGRGLKESDYLLFMEVRNACCGSDYISARVQIRGYLNAMLDYCMIDDNDQYFRMVAEADHVIKSILRHRRRNKL